MMPLGLVPTLLVALLFTTKSISAFGFSAATTASASISFLSRRRCNHLFFCRRRSPGSRKQPPFAMQAAPRNDGNFFQNVAASLFPKEALQCPQTVDQALLGEFPDNSDPTIPSWSLIRTQLERLMEFPEERDFRKNLRFGLGPASPLHLTRLFSPDNSPDSIRVVFYRDSAAWCPYCQKVWIALEQKRIPYKVEKINMSCYGNKPAEFYQLQPSGQIPVAIIDGRVYGQSNDILYALEEFFPDTQPLIPRSKEPQVQDRFQQLLRLERELFSAWLRWLTGAARNKSLFVETLKRVEAELSRNGAQGSFFLGPEISLVDIQFAPFLERMAASLLYFKGFMIRVTSDQYESTEYPAINRWFDAMETLPSYQVTKSDYYTHSWDLSPQLGGCTSEPAAAPFRDIINGQAPAHRDGGSDTNKSSWELPLIQHNGGIEPDWHWAGDELAARREAVERVSGNHEAILKFAARGAGRKGVPPVSAPLADPNAKSSQEVLNGLDAVFRVVCLALLEGTDKHDATMQRLAFVFVNHGGSSYGQAVMDCLIYVRDRIGVPRDMKLPAARQLRAHLNWAINSISKSQA